MVSTYQPKYKNQCNDRGYNKNSELFSMFSYSNTKFHTVLRANSTYINHVLLISHKMTEFINEFSRKEKLHFKHVISPRKTVCRVLVCVKSTSENQTFQGTSTSSSKGHAEFIALLNITNDLIKYLHQTDKDEITGFDLIIRLNNSPCHNSGCQSFIKYWIQHVVLGLVPRVCFRFILHFSTFYSEEGTCTEKKEKKKNSLFVALRLNCSYKNKKRNNELILTQNKILPID